VGGARSSAIRLSLSSSTVIPNDGVASRREAAAK
jgi:hypothetical protein